MTNESHVENTPTPPPGPTTPGSGPVPGALPWGMQINTFCMLMHLGQLCPFFGGILSIVMWATNKDRFPEVDRHGKVVLNWIISAIIYGVASGILCFIFIGGLLLLALMICSLIFIIIGAIKANEGVVWPYPLSIKFFK